MGGTGGAARTGPLAHLGAHRRGTGLTESLALEIAPMSEEDDAGGDQDDPATEADDDPEDGSTAHAHARRERSTMSR